MKWQELPGMGQMMASVITSLVVIGGAAIAAYSHFQTDDEALSAHTEIRTEFSEYRKAHASELNKFRIQQIEQQIANYRYQLLSNELDDRQREWIRQEIERLEQQKACIRNGRC